MSMIGRLRAAKQRRAYTLVELMVVVTIVGILSTSAYPLYSGAVVRAKMAEGIAGCGTIRTAMRLHCVRHGGRYPVLSGADGNNLQSIGISGRDIDGKYFEPESYTVNSDGEIYTITARFETYEYTLDQNGKEVGSFTTE